MRTRAAACLLALALALGALGCGRGDGRAGTGDPARAFAPLVQLEPSERHLPAGAGWFLARSTLWFADGRCGDRKVAVGTELAEQRTPEHDWLYDFGLGRGPAYFRELRDRACEHYRERKFYANEHNRPRDPGRPPGLGPRDGFYLDLVDDARGGRLDAVQDPDGEPVVSGVPVYFERQPTRVAGGPGLRLAYWLLFAAEGAPGLTGVRHEGDWERVDVLARGRGGSYEPVALRIGSGAGARTIAWQDVLTDGDGHPLLYADLGSHALGAGSEDCAACVDWPTWERLLPVRDEHWFGFGGAWGDVGRSAATTGPLGPHAEWAEDGGAREPPEGWEEDYP